MACWSRTKSRIYRGRTSALLRVLSQLAIGWRQAAVVTTNLVISLVLVQLPHFSSYPHLCARPLRCFGQSQSTVRQITGGAWRVCRRSCDLAVGVLYFPKDGGVGVVEDVDSGSHDLCCTGYISEVQGSLYISSERTGGGLRRRRERPEWRPVDLGYLHLARYPTFAGPCIGCVMTKGWRGTWRGTWRGSTASALLASNFGGQLRGRDDG